MTSTLFTNRIGGVSNPPYSRNNLAFHVGDETETVTENRRLLLAISAPSQFMNQTHGNTIAVVDGISPHEANADGLVTAETGIALGVLVADCIPLLLWSDQIIAAVHVGRKGLLNGVVMNAIQVMNSLGAENIQASLGPSICGRCYEVGKDIYDEVVAKHPAAKALTSKKTLSLDLPEALSHELIAHGVDVIRSQVCTVENSNFFSYRRDGITGRQAGLIWQ